MKNALINIMFVFLLGFPLMAQDNPTETEKKQYNQQQFPEKQAPPPDPAFKDIQYGNNDFSPPNTTKKQEFLFFTSDSSYVTAEEYLRDFRLRTDTLVNARPATLPQGDYWELKAVDAFSDESISSLKLDSAKLDINTDLVDKKWIWIIGDTEITILSVDNATPIHFEKRGKNLILQAPKDCPKCKDKVFAIKEQTADSLVLHSTYDDNEAITVIYQFKKTTRP